MIRKIEINETIPTKRAYHSSIYFQNKIYLIGGIGEGNYYLRECENYSIITHKWEFMPFLNYPRANPTLCIYNNSFIYVFRGSDKDSMLDTIEFLGLKNYNEVKIMKYELHNKYDVFTKVKKVIELCKTNEQLNVASSMLDNFELYYDENDQYLFNILRSVRLNKRLNLFKNK